MRNVSLKIRAWEIIIATTETAHGRDQNEGGGTGAGKAPKGRAGPVPDGFGGRLLFKLQRGGNRKTRNKWSKILHKDF